jgi:hypothetical protein
MAPFSGLVPFRHLSEKEDGRNTQQKMLTILHVPSTASRDVKCLLRRCGVSELTHPKRGLYDKYDCLQKHFVLP